MCSGGNNIFVGSIKGSHLTGLPHPGKVLDFFCCPGKSLNFVLSPGQY